MTVVVRSASDADARYLAPRLRLADAAEVRAASGGTPLHALLRGIGASHYTRVLVPVGREDEPICMWGIGPTPDPLVGCIWLLCGEALYEHRSAFLRESRNVFNLFEQQYPILWNFVDERNTAHVRFLRWHGCTFINRHEEFGAEKRPFLEFVRVSCANQLVSR